MSTHSMQATSGQQVIALDTAEEIGSVKHFVVSQDGTRVERLHIDGRRSKALFAEWDDLESFGDDRVVAKRADDASTSDTDRDVDVAKGNVDILGAKILDTAGFERGVVADVDFDGTNGMIVSVTSSNDSSYSVEHVRSLGSYALVVDA